MTSLDLSNNNIGKLTLPEGWSEKYGDAANYGYEHTDGRQQQEAPEGSKAEGAIAIANAIPTMGAMTNLNSSSNSIPAEEMKKIIAIAESMPIMRTLCEVRFKDKTITELDLSGKKLGADGAVVVSHYIHDNRAMTSLDISANDLRAEGAKHIAAAVAQCK